MTDSTKNLKNILSDDQITSQADQLKTYGRDWLKCYPSRPSLILFPHSHRQVEDIVRWAIQFKQALVPSGGRTGLSGGANAQKKEVVVSFERMNQILDFNKIENSLCVQPGVITKTIQEEAKKKSLYFPLSFASEGSSQIGGNTATNAGGVHVIRYGLLRAWILSLKVVTGAGHTLSLGKELIKNMAGYNLINLFIGSEGTLGLITQITLKLAKPPLPSCVLLLAIPNLQSLMELYNLFKTQLSLRAFEVFTNEAVKYVSPTVSVTFPLKKSDYYILIECDQQDQSQILQLFETAHKNQLIQDGVISESPSQALQFWAFRENISESLSSFFPYKNDISVRPSCVPKFLSELNQVIQKQYPDFVVIWFGHLGDGNLHINILKPEKESPDSFLKKCRELNKILFSLVQKYKGSISAEHGVGLLKKNYLHYSCSKEEIQYMKAIKNIFDPHGILNPGKIF